MDAVVLVLILAASVTLAVMGARGVLFAILHVMAHPPAPRRLRLGGGVAFAAALVWIWYMAPAIAARVPAGMVQSVLAR